MSAEEIGKLFEKACEPLECGAVPYVVIMKGSGNWLSRSITAGRPEDAGKKYHVPVNATRMWAMTFDVASMLIEHCRVQLNQSLTS